MVKRKLILSLTALLSVSSLGWVVSEPVSAETLRECVSRYQRDYGISADEAIRQCRKYDLEQPNPTQTDYPTIRSVSPINSTQYQQIIIKGNNFGFLQPYNGNSAYIRISDTTGNWNAGSTRDPGTDSVTLNITSWTDTEIVVSGFTGSYGASNWTLDRRDVVSVQVWNPQSGKRPSVCSRIVNDRAQRLCP